MRSSNKKAGGRKTQEVCIKMKNTNDVINSVKRLQRYGNENSRTTEKLRQAALTVAEFIIQQVGRPYSILPRGYRIEEFTVSGEERLILIAPATWCSGELESFLLCNEELHPTENYYWGDYIYCKRPSKYTLLKFAEDISSGLLDEIADQIKEEKEIETVKF